MDLDFTKCIINSAENQFVPLTYTLDTQIYDAMGLKFSKSGWFPIIIFTMFILSSLHHHVIRVSISWIVIVQNSGKGQGKSRHINVTVLKFTFTLLQITVMYVSWTNYRIKWYTLCLVKFIQMAPQLLFFKFTI